MLLQINLGVLISLLLTSSCWSFPNNQLYFLQPSLSSPEYYPELGLSPRYTNLVYDYINRYAGSRPPAQVKLAYPVKIEDFGVRDVEPELSDAGTREPVTEGPSFAAAPQPSHLLPSDFILLTRTPQSQFFGNFDVVKNNRMKLSAEKAAYPPIGGVVSNYILQRQVNDKVKRQTNYYSDGSDDEDVVISASEPRAENKANSTNSSSESKDEPQPSVAQSKPQAIALAGAGGVAQAAPVATAVVGKDGLAIAAPSATAVAGQGASGALQIGGDEKMRRAAPTSSKTSEKKK